MSALLFGTPYLAAFFGWISLALGALSLSMIARLSNGKWIEPFAPIVDALALLTVPAVLLFVPVACGLGSTHPPPGPEATAAVRSWLSAPAVSLRSFALLLSWAALAIVWRRTHASKVAAFGLVFLSLSVTLAGFDWIAALTPGWVSDALGLYWLVGSFTGAVGVVVLLATLMRAPGLSHRSKSVDEHSHAIGKVLWVGVILWAYIAFCAFLIVWIADLPAEIPYYASRVEGGWLPVTIALVLLHFVVPFVVLFSRSLKRSLPKLAIVAGVVVVAHGLDVLWCVLPSGPASVLDALPLLVLSGLLLFCTAKLTRVLTKREGAM